MNTGERLHGVKTGRLRWMRWMLLIPPSILTLLQAAFWIIFFLFLTPFIIWGLAVSDFRIAWVYLYAFLFIVHPKCLILVAANVVLWGGALYVCRTESHTKNKTVFYRIAVPISLFKVCGFLCFVFRFLRML